jgi:hypothetical protein
MAFHLDAQSSISAEMQKVGLRLPVLFSAKYPTPERFVVTCTANIVHITPKKVHTMLQALLYVLKVAALGPEHQFA